MKLPEKRLGEKWLSEGVFHSKKWNGKEYK